MSASHEEATTIGYFWIAQRDDGVGFACTSHDREVQRSGIAFESDSDLQPEELVLDSRLFGSSLKVTGSINSSALRKEDLLAGRWNAATVQLLAGDWRKEEPLTLLCSGELGPVRVQGAALTGEVSLLPSRCREQPCVQTSPECRAQLGDRQCRVAMRERSRRTVVTSSEGAWLDVGHDDTAPFQNGRARWLSGANSGLEQTIVGFAPRRIQLRETPSGRVATGDRLVLTEGCDRSRETCSGRFKNISNFRGEPDLPGTDILLRYPGA